MRRNTGHDKDAIMFFRFLDIVGTVKKNVVSSIERLGDGGLEILNLVVAKPNIPPDIAHNYKQVKLFSLYPFFSC